MKERIFKKIPDKKIRGNFYTSEFLFATRVRLLLAIRQNAVKRKIYTQKQWHHINNQNQVYSKLLQFKRLKKSNNFFLTYCRFNNNKINVIIFNTNLIIIKKLLIFTEL